MKLSRSAAMYAAVVALFIGHAPALTQVSSGVDSKGGAAAKAVANRPVVASAVGDPMNRVGDPIFVTITLRNESASPQIVKNLNVKVDASSGAALATSSACELRGRGEVTLAPAETYSQICRFPADSAVSATNPSGTSTGWRFPHWYSPLFSAEVRVNVLVEVETSGRAQFFPVVTVKAEESSIFIGGVIGALLLALFVWVERLLRNPEMRQKWIQSLLVTLLLGLRGGLLAMIALLISKTTQGVGSPVQLTVTDFVGGLLVGLFSYPLATWISSTLKLDGLFAPAILKEMVTGRELKATQPVGGSTPTGQVATAPP